MNAWSLNEVRKEDGFWEVFVKSDKDVFCMNEVKLE